MHGCAKAITLLSLLYLSKVFIYLVPSSAGEADSTNLCGKIRILLDKTLYYFSCLLEQQKKIKFKKIWQNLDEIIINAYKNNREVNRAKGSRKKSTVKGIVFIISLTLINWFFVVIQYID